MKKFAALLLCAIMLCAAFAGCAQQAETPEPEPTLEATPAPVEEPAEPAAPAETPVPEPETFIFTDSTGREVELPTNITRIAPSGPLAQMIIYTVAPDLMIGWSSNPSDTAKQYIEEKYWSLPEFGQFYGKGTLNFEALIAADPQVIIDMGDVKESQFDDMNNVQETTGIPTIFIEANLDVFADAYRTLGEILNVEEQANSLADYIDKVITMAEENAAKVPADGVKSVMFGTGESGLDCNARGSIHATLIDLIGAENAVVVEELSNKGGGNTVNLEQVMVFDPDVIILSSAGKFPTVAEDDAWQSLRAVQNNDYYEIPNGPYDWMSSPPSVNRIIGIQWLGNLLYPEIYDLDMIAVAQEFYKLFWHYDLTSEEAAALMANSTFKQK